MTGPWKLLALALVLAAAAVGAVVYIESVRADGDRAGYGRAQQEYLERERLARIEREKEGERRDAALKGVTNDARKEIEGARAAAAGAAAAGERLRSQLAEARRGLARCANPDPTRGGAPADATERMLADVQRRLDQAAERIAAHADAARTAGRACERAYDALKP